MRQAYDYWQDQPGSLGTHIKADDVPGIKTTDEHTTQTRDSTRRAQHERQTDLPVVNQSSDARNHMHATTTTTHPRPRETRAPQYAKTARRARTFPAQHTQRNHSRPRGRRRKQACGGTSVHSRDSPQLRRRGASNANTTPIDTAASASRKSHTQSTDKCGTEATPQDPTVRPHARVNTTTEHSAIGTTTHTHATPGSAHDRRMPIG